MTAQIEHAPLIYSEAYLITQARRLRKLTAAGLPKESITWERGYELVVRNDGIALRVWYSRGDGLGWGSATESLDNYGYRCGSCEYYDPLATNVNKGGLTDV